MSKNLYRLSPKPYGLGSTGTIDTYWEKVSSPYWRVRVSQRLWKHKIKCFDYIHSSMKILSEVSSKAKVKGLREDNILFMISTRLKDICIQYDVFILTATQLNSDYRTATQYDQNLLRGAKSIADKIDTGMIMLEPSQDDLTTLEPILNKGGFERPSIKMSIYKNRRGHYKDILLWCKSDRGTCRIEPMFATNYQYELIPIKDLKINVTDEKENKS